MKPGLAVLPMDVWADVFVFPIPWIKRKKLAHIVHEFKERGFAEKLQTFLHDPKCGKHTLNYLDISFKQTLGLSKQKVRFLGFLFKKINILARTPRFFGRRSLWFAIQLQELRISRD